MASLAILTDWLRKKQRWGLEEHLLGLCGCAALALAPAGVQLVPCLEFIGQSPRAGALQTPPTIYDLSLHPARVVEGLWAGVFGSVTQGNHRWLKALPPTFDHLV